MVFSRGGILAGSGGKLASPIVWVIGGYIAAMLAALGVVGWRRLNTSPGEELQTG